MQRADNQAVEIRAPEYGSERTVFLADGLVAIVRAHLDGLAGRGSKRWLFRGENGNPARRRAPDELPARPAALLRLGADRAAGSDVATVHMRSDTPARPSP
ncbi:MULTISPECIES: hypothetical protein [unclassified Pseudonocardia]|uniref:hypothetical protein n=1 Tax=unclassified Pseudonocardia TaxID=2619320 RepID=UPI001CF665BB|nr:hypothetical protein [Pseudonocardia sp. ICBG601]